jgi:hypothetical protein
VFDDGGGEALFAGGQFTIAGGVGASRIARWDGTSWTPLGSGLAGGAGAVRALTVYDDGGGAALFAGGQFTTAGGGAANRVASWDGSSWTALGSGVNMTVHALTVFGGELHAGGNFTFAGGALASRIARWDGASWTPLGSGVSGNVTSLTVFDGDLYVGGQFTTAGGAPASRIAQWDGASWSPLGSGMIGLFFPSSRVLALSAFDDGDGEALYAGGTFTSAIDSGDSYLARWGCEDPAFASFCDAADGSLGSCPCTNPGLPESGCDTPIPPMQGGGLTGGVRLDVVSQTSLPNRATVTGTGYPTSSTPGAVVIRAPSLDTAAPIVFGDGLRCIGVPVVRIGAAAAAGGISTHILGHGTMEGTGAFYYQIWFRSTPNSYCTPEAFNLSNGRTITW